MKSPSFHARKYMNACYHMRVLGYTLTCCISNTITMTIDLASLPHSERTHLLRGSCLCHDHVPPRVSEECAQHEMIWLPPPNGGVRGVQCTS